LENCLRKIREDRKLSRQKLADMIESSLAQITKLETSERRLSDVWIEKLCDALKCTPNDLLGYTEHLKLIADNPSPISIDREMLAMSGDIIRELLDEGAIDLDEAAYWDAVIELYGHAVAIKQESGKVTSAGLAARWVKQNVGH